MTSVVRLPLVWALRYGVPAMFIASWLAICGYATHWDMPMRRCNAPTGYCGKSGARKTKPDYDNSQNMNGIIFGLWAVMGLGVFASRLAAERIASVPSAKEMVAPDLRT